MKSMVKMKHSIETYNLFFGSLANPNRLEIINTLRESECNVSELCEKTGFEQTMVSHNLKRLERCGMVFMEKRGKHRYYRLNEDTIMPLMKIIDEHMGNHCVHVIAEGKKCH